MYLSSDGRHLVTCGRRACEHVEGEILHVFVIVLPFVEPGPGLPKSSEHFETSPKGAFAYIILIYIFIEKLYV